MDQREPRFEKFKVQVRGKWDNKTVFKENPFWCFKDLKQSTSRCTANRPKQMLTTNQTLGAPRSCFSFPRTEGAPASPPGSGTRPARHPDGCTPTPNTEPSALPSAQTALTNRLPDKTLQTPSKFYYFPFLKRLRRMAQAEETKLAGRGHLTGLLPAASSQGPTHGENGGPRRRRGHRRARGRPSRAGAPARTRRACRRAARRAAASSPWGWSGRAPCSRSRRWRSSWAGRSAPCRSSTSPGAGSPATPTWWCRRGPSRCTWTAGAPAGCGWCTGPSWRRRRRTDALRQMESGSGAPHATHLFRPSGWGAGRTSPTRPLRWPRLVTAPRSTLNRNEKKKTNQKSPNQKATSRRTVPSCRRARSRWRDGPRVRAQKGMTGVVVFPGPTPAASCPRREAGPGVGK